MERVDTISDVGTKTLPTGVVLYVIKDSEGSEYTTRDRAMAQTAQDAIGPKSIVHLDFDQKKNDRGFTNRYLNEIVPVPGESSGQLSTLDPASALPQPPPSLFEDTQPEPVGSPVGPFPAPTVGMNLDGQKRIDIARAVALKAAVDVLQYLPENERTFPNVKLAAGSFLDWLMGGD